MKRILIIAALLLFPLKSFAVPGQGFSTWTPLVGALADGDLFAITDISDTTQSASGSSKSILATQIRDYFDDRYVIKNIDIIGATKAKITYDTKGLVTSGSDLIESDIPALSIAKTTGLQTALDGKVDDWQVLTNVPAGAVFTDNQTTITGNAGTATTLATPRAINGVNFDGSAPITINAVDATARIATADKDATGGVPGLTLFKINFRNALDTFTSFFTNSNTAARTYTFPDKDGTIATTSDIPAVGTTAGTVAAGDDSRIVAGGTALQPAGSGASLTGITSGQIGGLGTAATTAATDYATAAQGGLAASALQPANVVDNLTSTSAVLPLSANQGKVLQDGKASKSIYQIDVKADCGATGDGTTDDSTAINACINSLPTSGGTVLFPPGTYYITSSIIMGDGTDTTVSTRQGIELRGTEIGPSRTLFTSSAPRVTIKSNVAGPAILVNGPISGWGLANIEVTFSTTSSSAIGIKYLGAQDGRTQNLYISSPPGIGVLAIGRMNLANTSYNIFENTAISLSSSFPTAIGIKITGVDSNSANSCFNQWRGITINPGSSQGPTGMVIGWADNEQFYNLTIMGVLTNSGGSRSSGIIFDFTDGQGPKDNKFYGLDIGRNTVTSVGTYSNPASWYTSNRMYGFATCNMETATIPAFPGLTVVNGAVDGPLTSTAGHIPTFSDTLGRHIQDSYGVVTTLGSPGVDTNIATEKAVRSAITSSVGAPVTPSYVTLGTDSTLTGERVLTGTASRITVTDGGANNTVQLSTPQDIATTSSVTFASENITGTKTSSLFNVSGIFTPSSDYNNYAAIGAYVQPTTNLSEVYGLTIKPIISPYSGSSYNINTYRNVQYGVVLDASYTGTVTNGYGMSVLGANKGGGTISNNYGLYIANQTAGTANYSIYTGTGKASFGDQIDSRVVTGTPPFTVASTTNVANLNASSLNGATFAAPGAIGGTTAGTGKFITISTTIPAATTYGATTTIDLSLGDSPSVTLTGNPTLAFSNPVAGQWHQLRLIQDATGSRTVTWPTTGLVCSFLDASGVPTATAPALKSAANAVSKFVIHTTSTTTAECTMVNP